MNNKGYYVTRMEKRKNRRWCKNRETENEIKGLEKQTKSNRTVEKESEKSLKNGKNKGRR
jgi:hypothetical protein